MNNIGPPIKLWFYTFGIVIFIFLSFAAYCYSPISLKRQNFKETDNKLKKLIIKNNVSRPLNKSIVFLGSSLTGCALENVPEIEKKISKNNPNKINLLRVAIKGLNNEILDQIHFFDYISKYPPNYLFIESNHLNIEVDSPMDRFRLLKLYLDKMNFFFKTVFEKRGNHEIIIDKYSFKSDFYKDDFNTVKYSQLLLKKRFVRTFSQNKRANKVFAELIKKNTKIIFLDMPRAPKLDLVYLDEKQKIELDNLLEYYQQNYNIECWKYPNALSNSDFYDGGHLNYKGAKKYEKWFISKFDSIK